MFGSVNIIDGDWRVFDRIGGYKVLEIFYTGPSKNGL